MALPDHVIVRRVSLALGLLALAALVAAQLVKPRGPAAAAPRPGTYRLRILTWNVGRVFLPFDQRAADSRASDEDLGHIAQVVRENDPDVVALQELKGREQLDRLLDLVGGGYVGTVPEREVNDRRVAIIARARDRDGGSADGPIFRTVTTSTGRSAAAVSLPVSAETGARALVVSIHLDAFDRDQRRVQAEELVDWANRQPESELFLCGDFNFDYDFLKGQGQAADHPDVQLYRLLSGSFEDLGRKAGLTTILARRIDYIFARTTGVDVREVRVIPGKRRALMDHDPVVGSFEIKGAAAAARR